MIIVKCGTISDNLFKNYLDRLVDRFYKILPLKEQKSDTLSTYIQSLQCELIGSKNLILYLNDDSQFINLISILQFFIDNEFDDKICKREIMKAINISKQLKSKYFPNENGDSDG